MVNSPSDRRRSLLLASPVLAAAEFLAANAALVRGVEVVSFAGVAARAGDTEGTAVEMPAMLGPAWRPAGAGPGLVILSLAAAPQALGPQLTSTEKEDAIHA